MKKNTSSVVIGVVIVLLILFAGFNMLNCVVGFWIFSEIGSLMDSEIAYGPSVGMIPVQGVIVSGTSPSPPQEGIIYSQDIIDAIEQAQEDDDIKAIVLRVNSPGGSVVGSNEIYQKLLEVEKPLIVSMGEMGASGGYYISCAADHIMVNGATLTGSIGVIAQMPNVEELMDKIGIEVTIIKSGKFKDEGSPFRPMTEQEKAIWQEIIDEAYDEFVAIVAEGRNLPAEEVRQIADGRIYTGLQAIELGLADEEGNLSDAIELAASLGDIEGEPNIIELYEPPTLFESLFMSLPFSDSPLSLSLKDVLDLETRPTLQYLYLSP